MNLEKQVCSLELSKRLKELEVKQESLFYWGVTKQGTVGLGEKPNGWAILVTIEKERFIQETEETYSAFTVAEMGELLPESIVCNDWLCQLNCSKEKAEWSCGYLYIDSEIISESAETEANARALMLIYLKENKLI